MKDREWLKQKLCTALGWDGVVVEGVVEAIESAATAQEIDIIVQEYMGGGAQARQLVNDFLQSTGKSKAPQGRKAETTAYRSHDAVASQRVPDVHPQPGKPEQKAGQRPGGALTIKHTAARKGKGPSGGPKGPPGSDLEKKVLNCLSCGKVYDFRLAGAGQLSNDLLRFLEYGGLCTFCGAQVALSYSEHSQTNRTSAATAQPSRQPVSANSLGEAAPMAEPCSSSATQAGSSAEEADSRETDAVAFKNRLVGYDRNAAQRTKVIDDQSDYFEIDSNTWLSVEERNELKARARDEAAAQEARKKKVTVTVDLLGRQVLMADSAEAQQLEATADKDLLARHANMPRHAVPSSTAPAATAPAGPNPEAGSHALRIAANPNLAGPAPMFIKQPMQQLAQPSHTNARSPLSESNASLSYAGVRSLNTQADDDTEEQDDEEGSGSSSRRTKAMSVNRNLTRKNRNHIPRLQHDDPFLTYDHDITVA